MRIDMRRWPGAVAAVGTLAAVASCSSDMRPTAGAPSEGSAATAVAARSTQAAQRIAELRARFVLAAPSPTIVALQGHVNEAEPRAVLGPGVVSSFEADGDAVRAGVPEQEKRGVRTASVSLPLRASGAVRLLDDVSHVAITFALRGTNDVPVATTAEGIALYAGGFGGHDVVHRVHAGGTEDFVVFESRPEREELVYDVDVSRVPGIRLVSHTFELVDADGTPVLRVAPPYVVGADGARSAAELAVDGCNVDRDPRAPWGRTVTPPGARTCVLRVGWTGASYPAVVDPSWVATGSMATARNNHTATLLGSGKVLVAGGDVATNTGTTSAELYDPGSGTFAATGSMSHARYTQTATLLVSGTLSGYVLVAGGWIQGRVAELYNPTTGLFQLAGFTVAVRLGHTATLLGSGLVLLAGGDGAGGAELYDPTAQTFKATAGLMTAVRSFHTATSLGSGKVLMAGGTNGGGNTAELFDPGSGTFAVTGSMSIPRYSHTAAALPSGLVLIAGGENTAAAAATASAELYDPNGGSFFVTGSMSAARVGLTATLVIGGKVLVAGGSNGTGLPAAAELYDPTAGSFSLTGPMNQPRAFHTATLLGSGKVLAAAGTNSMGGYLTSAEIFELLVGGACPNGNSDCGNGQCSDGFCCDQPCTGPCDVCAKSLGATADGTCTPLPAGSMGSPACGNGAVCDGQSGTCPNCTSDAGCIATDYCSASGTCTPQKPQGAGCNQAAGADCKVAGCHDCASGFCSDGVCCNSACNAAPCQVCAAALGASVDGTCGTAAVGIEHGSCQAPAACNGVSTSCASTCASDADCAAADYCSSGGACLPRKAQAVACNDAAAADCKVQGCRVCATNHCADGFCCDTACGLCGSCSFPQAGTCEPKPKGQAAVPAGACGAYLCNGTATSCPTSCSAGTDCITGSFCSNSACVGQAANGKPCMQGTDCASGFCAPDGVCCDAPCNGQCEACGEPGSVGSCTTVSGSPRTGHTPCTGNGACVGVCNGGNPTACAYPGNAMSCGPAASCTGDVSQPAGACDGTGSCATPASRNCTPYTCDSASGQCKQTCTSSADCAQGAVCDTGTSKCATATATCSDPFTAMAPDGTLTSCEPYRCKNGACATSCMVDADCAGTDTCVKGACVAASSASGSSGSNGAGGSGAGMPGAKGGCGCRTATTDGAASELALSLAACLLVATRRRSSLAKARAGGDNPPRPA
jgi:hypothetical protein